MCWISAGLWISRMAFVEQISQSKMSLPVFIRCMLRALVHLYLPSKVSQHSHSHQIDDTFQPTYLLVVVLGNNASSSTSVVDAAIILKMAHKI